MNDDFVRNCEQIGGITLTSSMSKIIDFLSVTQEAYHPKLLAKRIRLKYDTVRKYCSILSKRDLLQREKIGGFVCYKLADHILDTVEMSQEVKYHGFVLRCKTPWNLTLTRKGKWKQDLYLHNETKGEITIRPHQVGKTKGGEWLGKVHFQNEGQSLMVYYGQSGRPLSTREYVAFCEWLGGECGCDVFHGWPEWGLAQVGIGTDQAKVHFDRFDKKGSEGSVSISDFHGNVTRYYDKELANGEQVGRAELHPNFGLNEAPPNVLVEQAMSAFQGMIPNLQMANMLAQQNARIERLSSTLGELTNTLNKFMSWQMQNGGGR